MEYGTWGEAHPRLVKWTGVSTIAGALRRKVWYDHLYWKWSPNFYIIIVAPPGVVSKSTNIDVGHDLLRELDGINFGPDIASWPALLRYMGETADTFMVRGKEFVSSSVTLSISELGLFLDTHDSRQVDVLVDMWDCKRPVLDKRTNTNGNDFIENPWLNLMAGTTPSWMAANVSEYMLSGGLFSRSIFLHFAEKYKLVAHPELQVPPDINDLRESLVKDLLTISEYSGPYEKTKEVYEWEEEWYNELWKGDMIDAEGRRARKQAHLDKLSMVMCAASFDFPHIRIEHVLAANALLCEAEAAVPQVFSNVGQNTLSQCAREIVEIVFKAKKVGKKDLFRKYFFRKLSFEEFEEALTSAVRAELVVVGNEEGETVLKAL